MINPLLSVMFGNQNGADERYAGKTLKSHGFSSAPTSAGQLNFDLKGNRMNDRISGVAAGGQGLGQIIKLLVYLKGIGAFKGSAFQEALAPQQPMQDWKSAHDDRQMNYSSPSSTYGGEQFDFMHKRYPNSY